MFVPFACSVTIVVAYLMKKHGMTLSQALQHVKSKRPVASPNAGFIKQLQDLEKSMQGMPSLSLHFSTHMHILGSRLLALAPYFCSCDLCGEICVGDSLLCLSDAIVKEDWSNQTCSK